jgi:hypothetical protein
MQKTPDLQPTAGSCGVFSKSGNRGAKQWVKKEKEKLGN